MASSSSPSTVPSSSTKPSPTVNTKSNRLPAPTLFVGPPSRNASQLSVSRQTNNVGGREALNRQQSALRHNLNPDSPGVDGVKKEARGGHMKKESDKAIDAKWREMQSTLNEVELTAQSSTHVFGESHAAALDELRRAQVELARAWGRGNDDQANATDGQGAEMNINRFGGADNLAGDRLKMSRNRADTGASASTTLSDESLASDASPRSKARSGKSQLEDETAEDIRLASERRAANEAYFKKVDKGVKDVVAKLEVVAEAMRGVEGESRSLWSNSERSSNDTESVMRQSPASAQAK